jgi:putative methionine-R-sulfoxide reductase with GAF domain
VNHDPGPHRRHCLRQKVNTPAFASFDGVTGGMILDLSEEGMAMQALAPLEAQSQLALKISLGEPAAYLETTGYVAWADALGRAGVRFSDLPNESRMRLREWLTINASTPSCKAPRWVVRDLAFRRYSSTTPASTGLALSLETEPRLSEDAVLSTTAQYEFKSLVEDLPAAMNLIVSRACSITRGTAAAVAIAGNDGIVCRAATGDNAPLLGIKVDVSSGLSGECIRSGRALRCNDTEIDPRADAEACRQLGIRSILAAPVLYERDLVGLLEVFSNRASAFDDGDLAVVERLAQTVVLTLSRAQMFQRQ